MRDARKLFRLLKTLNEIANLVDVFEKRSHQANSTTEDILSRQLFVTSKLGYAWYWMFDNMTIMASFFGSWRHEQVLSKLAACGWVVGLLPQIATDVRDLCFLDFAPLSTGSSVQLDGGTSSSSSSPLRPKKHRRRKHLHHHHFHSFHSLPSAEAARRQRNVGSSSSSTATLYAVPVESSEQRRRNLWFSIVNSVGNLLSAISTLELPELLFGVAIPDGVIGVAGLLSALLTVHRLWSAHWRSHAMMQLLRGGGSGSKVTPYEGGGGGGGGSRNDESDSSQAETAKGDQGTNYDADVAWDESKLVGTMDYDRM